MKPPSRLRIAMLSIHSSPIGRLGAQDTGGMSVYIRELARILGARGHRVDIFTGVSPDPLDSVVQLYPNARLVHLKRSSSGAADSSSLYADHPMIFQALETFRRNENIEYDLIHSHYWLSGIVGRLAQRYWHRPHGITFHTVGAIKQRAYPGEQEPEIRLAQERLLAETCDFIVVSTPQEKAFFRDHLAIPEGQLKIVPCGVNLDLFQPVKKAAARKHLNLDGQGPLMLYVGRFVPIKGLERLIDAMAFLREYPSFRLILVGGDGAESQTHRALGGKIEKRGLRDAAIFAGRIDQKMLPHYYSAVDVLIMPSYHESFGLVAMESLACGTPVVTPPVGAMPGIIKDGVNGLIVNDLTPRPFARQIEGVLSQIRSQPLSPEDIRASVIDRSWENAAAVLLDVYRGALIP